MNDVLASRRGNRFDLRRTLRTVVLVPLLLFAGLGLVYYGLLRLLLGEASALRQSETIIAAGDEIRELAIDMETGVRGYVIAGDATFLQPYRAARTRLPHSIGTLAEVVRDDQRQQRHVSRVIADLRDWQQIAAAMIAQRGGGLEAQRSGKRAMDQARADIEQLLESERRLREERARSVATLARVVIGASSLLALLCGLAVAMAMRRQLKEMATSYDRALDLAEESLHLKDRFLATVSHELRTPMTTICGWASLLREDSLDEETTRAAIGAINDSARLQARLVDDLLDMSSATSGKLKLMLLSLDLREVVAQAVESMRATATARNVALDVVLPSSRVIVNADLQRIQQIIANLLSNAIRFTPAAGRVRVSLTSDASSAVMEMTDSGIGIDPRFLPLVFDHFTQADNSTSRAYGGLGLGLAIVRSLVELHGGSIEARSDGLLRGATFAIRLPLVAALAPNVEAIAAARASS
jgi:signal transduction histidine kinase